MPSHLDTVLHKKISGLPSCTEGQKGFLSYLDCINILLLDVCSRMKGCELGQGSQECITLCSHAKNSCYVNSMAEALKTLESHYLLFTLVKWNTKCCQHWSPSDLYHWSQQLHIRCSIVHWSAPKCKPQPACTCDTQFVPQTHARKTNKISNSCRW